MHDIVQKDMFYLEKVAARIDVYRGSGMWSHHIFGREKVRGAEGRKRVII